MKSFFVALVAFLIFDYLWLGFVVKDFNLAQLAEIGRIVNGDFDMLPAAAAGAYLLMAFAVAFFVMPKVQGASLVKTFAVGVAMGLVIYGVYDMTNLAVLKNYPVPFAFADMAWGGFVTGAVSVVTKKLTAFTPRA